MYCAMAANGSSRMEMEYIWRHHQHLTRENQCSSTLVKRIKAPHHLVRSRPFIEDHRISDLSQLFPRILMISHSAVWMLDRIWFFVILFFKIFLSSSDRTFIYSIWNDVDV